MGSHLPDLGLNAPVGGSLGPNAAIGDPTGGGGSPVWVQDPGGPNGTPTGRSLGGTGTVQEVAEDLG